MKKKLKEKEARIVKLRNDSQKYKIDLDKALKIIEREVGEGQSIDDILKSDSNWKGRAQKIEALQSKIKKLKVEFGDSTSTFTMNTEFAAPKTHAEKNLETLGVNRARELEKLKEELVEIRDKYDSLNQKYKGACSRKVAVENEMKELKSLMASKVKILLDKTENDDKLINMLRSEVTKLKSGKGAKTASSKTKSLESNNEELIYSLKNENAILKNNIIVLQAQSEKKEAKINELMKNCIGAPSEEIEERDTYIYELEQKVEELTRQTQEKFTRKSQTESEKIIKDLSQQNAKLRLKVSDLSEKLRETQID